MGILGIERRVGISPGALDAKISRKIRQLADRLGVTGVVDDLARRNNPSDTHFYQRINGVMTEVTIDGKPLGEYL